MNKFNWTIIVLLLASVWACQKKTDLVDKAFKDKNFDQRPASAQVENTDSPEEEDKELTETQTTVLVDQLVPPQEDTIFLGTGTTDRPSEQIFAKDPEAPLLNFEDAKLYDIIHVLCENMGLNYIIDPAVSDQTVTIQMVSSDNKLKTSALFDLILKLHDLTMVVREPFVYIVPIASPEVSPGLELLYGSRPNKNLRREELVIQLIPLRYVEPAEITKVIKDFLSSSARILEEPKNDVLIIIDKAQFIAKVMDLIPIFDVDSMANRKMVFYQLAHVDSIDTTNRLQEILAVYGYEADGDRLNIVPIETLNGILVVADTDRVFKELTYWVEKFDKEAQLEDDQVFVYQVENTTADTLAGTLSQLFGLRSVGVGGRGSSAASNRRTTNPNQNLNAPGNINTPNQQPQNQLQQRNQTNQPNEGDEDAPIMIVDQDNNALIFNTTPREYYRIRKTLSKLDVLPRQVFLEVTVLSVDLDDSYDFGISWSAEHDTQNPNSGTSTGGTGTNQTGNVVSGQFSGSPLPAFNGAYSLVKLTSNINATITALKGKGYANILQQPHIMAIDNKAANISVGQDTPIVTTTSNVQNLAGGGGTGGLTPASSSTIQYRSTGVSLAFTPHINANGVIRLEVNLGISSPGETNAQGGVPIGQQTLQTEMIVRDGQTVVMGGLISDDESWRKQTVPFLGRIPLIRHLFTNHKSSSSKSELIILITPHLIDSEEKSVQISKEFKDKILNEFESFRNKRD